MNGKVRLNIVEGPMKGREFTFEQHDTFLFGRARECHACLSDDTHISRHHFLLEVAPPNVCLRDLGSLNGTYVNGAACGRRHVGETPFEGAVRRQSEIDVRSNDRIQVGQTVFHVNIEKSTVQDPRPKCSLCSAYLGDEDTLRSNSDCACPACRASFENSVVPDDSTMQSPSSRKSLQEIAEKADVEIDAKLGKGGMGVVYRARRRSDKKLVALKIILPKVAVDERSRKFFKREMDLQHSLKHTNIVHLQHRGVDHALFYFVMDYCDLGDVGMNMNRFEGKLTLKQAFPIFMDVLRGMDYAHKRKLVHRDIKPANILLKNSPKGIVAQVGDFGLAKCFDRAGLSGLTTTGTFSGSYNFMPREQLLNYKYVQPVSDVWSLAATFFYTLTGFYPRDIDSDRDPLEIVLNEECLPIQERDPSIPDSIAKVLNKALRTDPEKRYPTAGEFRSALKRAAASV